MTKLADLKEGDCFISLVHGGPVVRASNPPGGLPYKWAWSRLGCDYQKPKEAAVYEKTDLTLIEHYSTHPTPTPLLPVAKKEPEAAKPFSFSGRVPNMIPGDMLNGVLLSEIVQRYESGMREERVEIGPNGKKRIRMRKGFEVVQFENDGPAGGLDHIQFLAAQKEFTRLVKAKAAEARKAEKESVKVDRDTDYWNE